MKHTKAVFILQLLQNFYAYYWHRDSKRVFNFAHFPSRVYALHFPIHCMSTAANKTDLVFVNMQEYDYGTEGVGRSDATRRKV